MAKLTIGGKPVRAGDLTRRLMQAAAEKVAREMRERVSAIRHPKTGEFPMVIVEGDTLDDMSIRVEGSQELLAIVKSRLSSEEAALMNFDSLDVPQRPKAFLSYGWEDRDLARKIAERLTASGIGTWWAEWEIGAGDSIRRKIELGIENCTHFIVLLTATSISRPWVQEEIDVGFVRKVSQKSRFIPLRYGLSVDALPALLSGMLSPEVDPDALDLKNLVSEIYGLQRKPTLGPAPAATLEPKTGHSAAATAVAGQFVNSSRHAQFGDPQMTVGNIAGATGLSEDDVTDALHELRHRVKTSHDRVLPKETLFSEFDRYWKDWDPAQDALRIAADLVNDPSFPVAPHDIAVRYGWEARRLNPALAYLRERDAVHVLDAFGGGPYNTVRIRKTDATRRFVRSRT
jgi:hypothetical protein